MVMRTVAGAPTGEDVDDLRAWLRQLAGAPQVHEVVALHCGAHGNEQPTWAYAEADPASGVARRRCLACAATTHLLDSEQRWTHPQMWACRGCGQSIVELAAALSLSDGDLVEWVALGARCVECGRLSGLTDVVVDRQPLAEVLSRL